MKKIKDLELRSAVGNAVAQIRGKSLCNAVFLGGMLCAVGLPQASAQQLQEILVTSERRETNLQDTPISVMALDDVQLASNVVRDLFDISEAVPNLNINPNRGSGPAEPAFNIRGVGNGGVALYIDNIFFPNTTRSALRTADLASLEVLRGPQGTLFGRNSTGGAIRVFTRKPNENFEGNVAVQAGNYGLLDVEGRLNVPLSDNVFVKGEIAKLTRDGYVKRAGVSGGQSELGDVDDTIGSLALRWIPNEAVTVDIKGRYEESDRNPVVRDLDGLVVESQPLSFHYNELNRHLQATGQPALTDNDPRLIRDDYTISGFCFLYDNDPTTFDSDCNTGYSSENRQFTANVEWDINANHSFSFNGGIQDVEVDQVTDWLTIGAELRTENYESEAIMLEGVLNSTLIDGRLDLVSGINYYSEEIDEFSHVIRNHSPNQMADTRDIYGDTFDRDATGIFSQGVYQLTDFTNLTIGLRYTSEDYNVILREWESGDFNITGWKECSTASSAGGGGVLVRDPNCMVSVPGDEKYNELDWKAGIAHDLSDDVMVFATVSKAYRSGAFSHTLSPSIDPANVTISATEAEKLVNKEVGIRSELLDNRLRFNFTYFNMDFTNRQGPRLVPEGDTARVLILNLGDVDIDGWELDANLALTENLSLSVAAGYTDAQLADPAPPNNVNIAGVPEYSYNIGGNYTTQLSNGELTINMNYTWQDDRHSTPGIGREDTHIQSDYGLLNGNIRYVFGDEREWTVALSGSNLLDESYGLGELRFGRFFMGPPPGTSNYMQLADRGAPRMFFARLSRDF